MNHLNKNRMGDIPFLNSCVGGLVDIPIVNGEYDRIPKKKGSKSSDVSGFSNINHPAIGPMGYPPFIETH